MIEYKVFTPEDISVFLNNEKLLKETFYLATQNTPKIKEYENQRFDFFKKDFKEENTFVFLAFSKKKLVGFLSGFINKNEFNTINLFVSPEHHSKSIGTKLKIYSIAYLRSKKGINNFVSLNVVNPKIYSLNKRVVSRKNLSKTTSYSFEKTERYGFKRTNYNKIISKKIK